MVKYAEQITDPILRKGFFLYLRGRFRNSENEGGFAEIATSLNHIATIGRRSAFRKKSNRLNNERHVVRVFRASWVFFSAWAVNYAPEITEATQPAWQPVERFLPPLVFLRLHGHFRRKSNLGGRAKMALRSDLASATGSFSVCRQLRRETNHGD